MYACTYVNNCIVWCVYPVLNSLPSPVVGRLFIFQILVHSPLAMEVPLVYLFMCAYKCLCMCKNFVCNLFFQVTNRGLSVFNSDANKGFYFKCMQCTRMFEKGSLCLWTLRRVSNATCMYTYEYVKKGGLCLQHHVCMYAMYVPDQKR